MVQGLNFEVCETLPELCAASRQIRCHADVVALGRNLAFENVDIVKHA